MSIENGTQAVAAPPVTKRTPPKAKARQLAKYLRSERPDYDYMKQVFRHLRTELGVEIPRVPKRLPYVPTEEEIRRYYEAVWQARRSGDVVLIKTLLYTGVRVSELVHIRLEDVDLDACRIRINRGKGDKDRVVPPMPRARRGLSTCSSPPGTSPTVTGGCGRSWPATLPPPAWPSPSPPTSCATSCSPG